MHDLAICVPVPDFGTDSRVWVAQNQGEGGGGCLSSGFKKTVCVFQGAYYASYSDGLLLSFVIFSVKFLLDSVRRMVCPDAGEIKFLGEMVWCMASLYDVGITTW